MAALAVTAVIATATPGGAVSPAASGWWYEANAGLPVAPPPPPTVPPGGLFIESGFGGPAAIAALAFSVPSGASIGPLVLDVAATSTLTQAPFACPLTSASFRSVQDGPWAQRPAYDCQRAEAVGKLDATKTTVTFDVSAFLTNGVVAVAILPAGPVDEAAFAKPGPGTLTVTPAATSPGPSPLPSPSNAPSPAPTAPLIGNLTSPGGTFPAAAPIPPVKATTPPSAVAPVGSPSPRPGAVAPASRAVATATTHGSSWRSRAAQVFALAALLFVLVAWSEGYGILGGRVPSLASPLASSPGDGADPGPGRAAL